MHYAQSIINKAYLAMWANYPVTISYEPTNKIPLGLYAHRAGPLVNLC